MAVIVLLLIVGAVLRPVAGMTPQPVAVAPQYARSAVTLYEVLAEPGYLVPVARRTPDGGGLAGGRPYPTPGRPSGRARPGRRLRVGG